MTLIGCDFDKLQIASEMLKKISQVAETVDNPEYFELLKLNYTFNDISLLEKALTHSSFANEARNGISSNERLEFLGDSVLSVIVSDYIFKEFRNIPEGELTKLRASLVCEKSLCGFSRELNLGEYLKLGKGEDKGGGRERDSILADAFEAVLAAIYLDGGIENACRHFGWIE